MSQQHASLSKMRCCHLQNECTNAGTNVPEMYTNVAEERVQANTNVLYVYETNR